jgi:Tim17/Tim22/Tim23/Pmp24 family
LLLSDGKSDGELFASLLHARRANLLAIDNLTLLLNKLYMLSKAVGIGSGLFIGYTKMMWYPDPYQYDYKGVELPFRTDYKYALRCLKAPLFWSALVCATFSLTECAVEQLRDEEKESTYVNASVAGAVTGALMGSMTRRLDIMAASALCTGVLMGMVEYNGQTLQAKPINEDWIPKIPPGETESDITKELKLKYPEFRNL